MDTDLPLLGTYREAPPPPALRPHFRCAWVHRSGSRPRSLLVVPDGSIDLCWRGGKLTVLGPDRVAFREPMPAHATTIGLRFRAGAAASWLGVPAVDLAGRRVPLEDLWGAEAQRIGEAAGEEPSAAHVLRKLETAFAIRTAQAATADEAMRRVFALLRSPAPQGRPALAGLAGMLGTSERTLRRRCHEAFGYGPKTLERVLRFQRFLALVGEEGLAGAAFGAGYADQPHLARDIRQLSGLTPTALLGEIVG